MKELQVTAIENGSVIDHIDSEKTLKIMEMLELNKAPHMVTLAFNLKSRALGAKGIIKVADRKLTKEEIEKVALLAPNATINYIEDYKVVKKESVVAPESVVGIIQCDNIKCITNFERVATKFVREGDNYRCNYCERTIGKNSINLR